MRVIVTRDPLIVGHRRLPGGLVSNQVRSDQYQNYSSSMHGVCVVGPIRDISTHGMGAVRVHAFGARMMGVDDMHTDTGTSITSTRGQAAMDG